MCKASNEPGGPRRCSADMRARAQESHDRVAALEQREREIEELLDARRTYGSEAAFRAALNTRIREIARTSGVDSTEVARRFALQQFVSRLFDRDPESWLVTGGTALQYRTAEARATADLDLAATRGVEDLTAALTAAPTRPAFRSAASKATSAGPLSELLQSIFSIPSSSPQSVRRRGVSSKT